MQILLHNRTQFYEALLPRIPDFRIRELLIEIRGESQELSKSLSIDLGKSNINIEKLLLLDPLCKPDFGRKWGRTAISLEEAMARALRFEELILLACREHLIAGQDAIWTDLNETVQLRYSNLLSLADDLRYHRVRLVETP